MKKFVVENGKASYDTPDGVYKWAPKGKSLLRGMNPARADVYGVPTNAARMFIGFNVGQKPVHSVDKIAGLFKRERSKQTNDKGEPIPVDASFVLQKGFFTSPVDGLVYEDSTQLVVLSLFGESEKKFTDNMIEIAGIVARDFQQETVILEVQRKGVPTEVYGVSWKD